MTADAMPCPQESARCVVEEFGGDDLFGLKANKDARVADGPNPRVRRGEARDPQAGELRQASCQYAVVADGHPPQHGYPCDRILRVFS